MKPPSSVFCACSSLLLILSFLTGCGPTHLGARAGLSFGVNEIEDPYMTSGMHRNREPLEVVEETHTPAFTAGLTLRQRFSDGLFVQFEPAVRFNNRYTTLFKVGFEDDPPSMTEIVREHASLDVPILIGWLFEGTTFDLTLAVGTGLTTALSSSQTTFGFSEVDGQRVSRSWRGEHNDGGSDHRGPIALGVVGFEKQINPLWTLGFDLRYMTSIGGFYSHPGEVYEPNIGSSEHYYYSSEYRAFGFSISASMNL